uniref:Tyrosine-protein kinase n=1 Tax=Gasterosteus aculeatus aculeatus TaxID=481459 RepID=G3P7N7_GASAC
MAECVRKACPCLGALWQRIFSDKKPPPAAEGDAGGDGEVEVSSADDEPRTPITASDAVPEGGSMFRALWAFESRHQDELSFQEGDLFTVVNRSGDWWSARKIEKNGRVLETGIVPKNYLERAESLQMQQWYFGQMNRFESQGHLLGSENDDGAFLIRRSEKENIGYVLSVRSGSRVKHFKVLRAEGSLFFVEYNKKFSSLIDLVEHYCGNNMLNIGTLGKPCKRKKPTTTDLNHFTVDEWELPKEEFTLEEQLGTGYFAEVYRGRWKNHINVAIKIIKIRILGSNDALSLNHLEFQREVQMLKSLRHPHLISLFATCTVSKGSLLTFLRGSEGRSQDIGSLIDMGAQVADGMSYLEEKNSIHRDLAARNVLVGEDYMCKVADFGLARVIKEPFYITEDKKIPYKWSAPEAISHGKFSNKSDVWSFGVLLYEILTYGGVPYPAFTNQETYQQVTDGFRMPAPNNCSESLYKVMLSCWSADPSDRPSFHDLKVKLDSSSYEME